MRILLLGLMALWLAACGGTPEPTQSDAEVKAEEARVIAVLKADDSGRVLSTGTPETRSCKVRLLRIDPDKTYLWARCDVQPGGEGVSAPFAVSRTGVVQTPGDGDLYVPTIREIFPKDLVDTLVNDGPDLIP